MSWRNTGGSGFMNLKDRRWGFPLPTRGLPTFGLSSSYRYQRQGWTRCGIEPDGEIRYELMRT